MNCWVCRTCDDRSKCPFLAHSIQLEALEKKVSRIEEKIKATEK